MDKWANRASARVPEPGSSTTIQETTMSRSTTAPPPRLLTVAQAADHLGTTTSRLHELVSSHAITNVRICRAIRIPQYALDQLDHAGDQRRSSPPPHRSASDTMLMPQRSHSAQHPGEPRRPSSRETANPDTDLHPCATRHAGRVRHSDRSGVDPVGVTLPRCLP